MTADLLGYDPEAATLAEIRDLQRGLLDINRPNGGFRLVLADPPWKITMFSAKGEGKSPQRHYKCLETHVISAMRPSHLMAPNSICMMWATAPMLTQQLHVLKGWGFQYVSMLPWFKASKNTTAEDPACDDWKAAFGGGYIFRNCAEYILIGKQGEPVLLDARRSVRGALFDPLREHSRKPDGQYDLAEALSPGPYLELFSRTDRPGWVHFGDQAGIWRSE